MTFMGASLYIKEGSVANKTFSVGQSMSRGSEGHFEAPVCSGKLHISTSKKH